MSHQTAHYAEAAMGAFNELARRSGHGGHVHNHGAAKAGELAVKGLAVVAPRTVAAGAAAAGTVITATGSAITAAGAAIAAAPVVVTATAFAAIAAAGYGIYRFVKRANE
jgi:hypothetical protein